MMFGVLKWCAYSNRCRRDNFVECAQDPNSPSNAQGTTKQLPDEGRMVKKFRRAAAGIDEQLPSDLRPPLVLQVRLL